MPITSSMLIAVRRRAVARATVILYAVCAWSGHLPAQNAPNIPIRTLAPSTAVSEDSVGAVLAVRELSSGSVLANDFAAGRVVLFDGTLRQSKVVIDTIGGDGPDARLKIAPPSATLIRYLGDSSLYADQLGKSFLVLDANGKVARAISVPRTTDIQMLALSSQYGHPGFDNKGRLVYRGVYRPPPAKPDPDRPWLPRFPVLSDSAPVVRADWDMRTIDTLAALKVNVGISFNKLEVANDGNVIMQLWVDPLGGADQWAILSDGTIAVVSVHDYHIDWTDPDGTHRSTPKMPFDWKRLTEADKLKMIDTLRPALERLNNRLAPQRMNTPSGPRTARQVVEFVPLEKVGDFELPIQPGSVKADRDARLWILPQTSLSAKAGLLYDVVNRNGAIVERVQFPTGYVLAGFGDHGVLYVVHLNGRKGTLERTTVR